MCHQQFRLNVRMSWKIVKMKCPWQNVNKSVKEVVLVKKSHKMFLLQTTAIKSKPKAKCPLPGVIKRVGQIVHSNCRGCDGLSSDRHRWMDKIKYCRTNLCFSSGISLWEYTRCEREKDSVCVSECYSFVCVCEWVSVCVCDKECVQNYKRWEHIWRTNTHIQYVC